MKTTSAMLVASALSLTSMFALADDRTPLNVTPAEQAKTETNWMKAAIASMWSRTPPSESPEIRRRFKRRSDAAPRDDQNARGGEVATEAERSVTRRSTSLDAAP